jgi:GTPase SAR1 family protein
MTRTAAQLSRNDRLSLSTLISRTTGIVSEIGPQFVHYGGKLNDLAARFAEGRYHLAVLGQFKRGKSTLLNALVGDSVLPMGVVPLTAAPTFLQYGEAAKIIVRHQNGCLTDEHAGASAAAVRACLTDLVTEKGNPRNRRGIAEVQVELPTSMLSDGVVLIDTPGIGSTYRHNTAATLNFLQQCDAALFLVSADPPITEVELEFLRQVKQKVPRLFFVMNKVDYLDAEEREEALDFYQRVLAEEGGWDGKFPVFCVSARMGLAAKTASDSRGWIASGMAQLESFLLGYLAREKFSALADAVSRRSLELVDAVQMEAGIALHALRLPQQELEEKIGIFEQSLKRAASERRLIQDVLEGDKKRVMAIVEEQSIVLRQEAEKYLKEIMHQGPALRGNGQSTKAGIQNAWAEAIPEYFEQKREELNGLVKQFLLECLEPHEQRLFRLLETLRHTAADLFQVRYMPLAQEQTLEIKRRPYWVLNTWNTDPLPVLQSMDQRLDGLVRRNVENIRWSLLQNLNITFAGFVRRTRERLDETVAATKGAMDMAHTRRQADIGSIQAEVERMSAAISALEAAKADFDALRYGESSKTG